MTKLNLLNLVDKYYLSNDFNSLVDKTKVDYQYCAGFCWTQKLMAKLWQP